MTCAFKIFKGYFVFCIQSFGIFTYDDDEDKIKKKKNTEKCLLNEI